MIKINYPVIKSISCIPQEILDYVDRPDTPFYRKTVEHELGTYTVFSYYAAWSKHFSPIDTWLGMWQREFRGLIFDSQGKLVCRPLPKFMNIEEDKDWCYDPSECFYREKFDGSMIASGKLNGCTRLFTKGGITETSQRAEELFVLYASEEWTAVYEFVGPSNPHVLTYPENELVLLCRRHNETGVIFWEIPDGLFCDYKPQEQGTEGVVVWHPSGHIVKAKTPWFFKAHQLKSEKPTEKNFFEAFKMGNLDDYEARFPDTDMRVWMSRLEALIGYLNLTVFDVRIRKASARDRGVSDREFKKEIAITYKNKPHSAFAFGLADGKFGDENTSYREAIFKFLKICSFEKYSQILDWYLNHHRFSLESI